MLACLRLRTHKRTTTSSPRVSATGAALVLTYSEPGNHHRDLSRRCLVLDPHQIDRDTQRRGRGRRAGVAHDPKLREGENEDKGREGQRAIIHVYW
jgi:hypothetical protein